MADVIDLDDVSDAVWSEQIMLVSLALDGFVTEHERGSAEKENTPE